MYDISVSNQDDVIYIQQPTLGEHSETVMLHPEQIDLLVRWLKEAKAEIARRHKKREAPPKRKATSKPPQYLS